MSASLRIKFFWVVKESRPGYTSMAFREPKWAELDETTKE